MCCCTVSDYPHTIDNQINDLHRDRKLPSRTFKWLSWPECLFPFIGVLLAIIIILLSSPILIRLAVEAINLTIASLPVTIFSLKVYR